MARIQLTDILIYANHGWYPEEQRTGNTFVISVAFDAGISATESTDDLADTVNYEDVLRIVEAEMAITSKLIEHVGIRILKRFQAELPAMHNTELTIRKKRPFAGKEGDVAITLTESDIS